MGEPALVVLGSPNLDFTVVVPRLPARGETVAGPAAARGPGGKGAMGVSDFERQIITGLVILIAVVLDAYRLRLARKLAITQPAQPPTPTAKVAQPS